VDLVGLGTLAEHDAATDGPLLFLACGHAFASSTLDVHMSLADYYRRRRGPAGGGGGGDGGTFEWGECLDLPERLQV
jgi:hypothetical protein